LVAYTAEGGFDETNPGFKTSSLYVKEAVSAPTGPSDDLAFVVPAFSLVALTTRLFASLSRVADDWRQVRMQREHKAARRLRRKSKAAAAAAEPASDDGSEAGSDGTEARDAGEAREVTTIPISSLSDTQAVAEAPKPRPKSAVRPTHAANPSAQAMTAAAAAKAYALAHGTHPHEVCASRRPFDLRRAGGWE
jgi:hypothetical protein